MSANTEIDYTYHVKMCGRCGVEHEDSAFGPDLRTRTGLQSSCRDSNNESRKANYRYEYSRDAEYKRNYARARSRKQRADLLDLLGAVCAGCGETDPVVLDVDHVDGDGHLEKNPRNRGGAKMLGKAMENPDRFQVLCCNCHRRKTAVEKGWWS